MATFDVNKVIRIDLESCNMQEIFIIARFYELNFENMLNLKNDNFKQLYIQTTDGSVIAYVKETFNMIEQYRVDKKTFKKLKSISVCEVPTLINEYDILENYLYYIEKGYDMRISSLDEKIEEIRNKSKEVVKEVVLDLDTILDKINESGLSSITEEEREFLDKISKSKIR
jgi:hypothetical protein